MTKLSAQQSKALRIARRNGVWWVSGRAGMATANALERRGLVSVESMYLGGRIRHSVRLTATGTEVAETV